MTPGQIALKLAARAVVFAAAVLVLAAVLVVIG